MDDFCCENPDLRIKYQWSDDELFLEIKDVWANPIDKRNHPKTYQFQKNYKNLITEDYFAIRDVVDQIITFLKRKKEYKNMHIPIRSDLNYYDNFCNNVIRFMSDPKFLKHPYLKISYQWNGKELRFQITDFYEGSKQCYEFVKDYSNQKKYEEQAYLDIVCELNHFLERKKDL